MSRQVFDYDPPDRFVAGTVGQPGQRTFFLQARSGARLTSVALEKAQVSILAERVDELLDEVLRRSGGTAPVPAVAPTGAEDTAALDTPIEEEFRVGTLTISWDNEEAELLVEARSQEDDDEDEDEDDEDEDDEPGLEASAVDDDDDDDEVPDDAPIGPDVLRVRLTPAMALGFARRARRIVGAGRPPCPFCGQPLNPEGHICARKNGYLN